MFNYENHKKMIYYDGHERCDVKVDRAVRLVTLQVLKEVRTAPACARACVCTCMCVRVCVCGRGCVGAWVRGCVGAWVRGCVGARV